MRAKDSGRLCQSVGSLTWYSETYDGLGPSLRWDDGIVRAGVKTQALARFLEQKCFERRAEWRYAKNTR